MIKFLALLAFWGVPFVIALILKRKGSRTVIIEEDDLVDVQCLECGNEATCRCQNEECKNPLCDECVSSNGFCPDCQEGME